MAFLTALALVAAAPGTLVAQATRNEALDELFKPRQRGFLGADGAASVSLPGDRTLWVFGDTIVGTLRNGKKEGPMVRNSIAIMDAKQGVEFFWDLSDGIMGDFFQPQNIEDPAWYWPGTGITIDGTLYLFLSRMDKGEGPAGFAFRTVGCTLFRVSNPGDTPRAWKIERDDLGLGNDHFNVNAACYLEGDYLYLLGYHDGPNSKPMERRSILGRIEKAKLDGSGVGKTIRFHAGDDKWIADPAGATSLFRPGPTETAIHFDAKTRKYYCLTLEPFKEHVLLTEAPAITGPWSEPRPIFTIDEVVADPDLIHAYTTRIHPMLSKPGTLTFSYVTNTKDFWSVFSRMDVYFPRFVDYQLTTTVPEN